MDAKKGEQNELEEGNWLNSGSCCHRVRCIF